MSRSGRLVLITYIVLAIVATWWYYAPQPIHRTWEGVSYQLGTTEPDTVAPVTIEVKGTLQRHLFGGLTFRGTMQIDDVQLPAEPSFSPILTVRFRTDGTDGHVAYYRGIEGGYEAYGIAHISKRMTEITIAKYTHPAPNNASWNSDDGQMISAPSSDRDEALALSNRLMQLEKPLQ